MATAKRVLDIARRELWTKESPANSNTVKYNTWYYGHEVAGKAYPWCMAFVQWCFHQAGARLPYITASCSGLLTWYQRNQPGKVFKSAQPGDIVIYNFGHTGIVEEVSGSNITAIEGNTAPTASGSQSNGGMVCRKTRGIKTVTAFIRPLAEDETEDDDMDISKLTDAEVLQLGKRLQAVMGRQAVSPALAPELAEAKAKGLTDGSSPGAFCTRAQAAVMTLRAAKM